MQLDGRLAVDIQRQLESAIAELGRLSSLIGNAGDELMTRFGRIALASGHLESVVIKQEVSRALIALQFQDMALQLVEHTTSRVRAVADSIGDATHANDASRTGLPERAAPVAQHLVDAGSDELF